MGEPATEYSLYLDGRGRRLLRDSAVRECREGWDVVRERKTRDEKCSAAFGLFSERYYEREKHGLKAPTRTGKLKGYAPLHLLSGYAFGRSTMLAEDLADLLQKAEVSAAAIADPFSLVGCIEFAHGCRRVGVKPLIGASFELPEGGELVLIARNAQGYRSLCRLISECHLAEPRGYPLASWERLEAWSEGLLCLTGGDLGPLDRLLVRGQYDQAKQLVERLIALYGRQSVWVELERSYLPWGIAVERRATQLAQDVGVPLVAGGAVCHARPEGYPAQDVLLCAHTLCGIDEVVGRKPMRDPTQPQPASPPMRSLNAERHLRAVTEMHALWADRPELLEETLRLAERCDDDVLPARTELPRLFEDDPIALRSIVEVESRRVYPHLTRKHSVRIEHELERIIRLGFSTHFLIAWDVCRWASEQRIQMSGRGSSVDSALAYVLGFSRIDAIRHKLHFDRFLPDDGHKRPDIDIDFEAKRRDDVRGYMIRKFGVDRTATVSAIGAYNTRGIVREVGKVMGLPNEAIGFLAKRLHGGVSPDRLEAALERRPELRALGIPKERFRWVFRLASELMDVPRNIRCHPSGVVASARPLWETVPVMPSAGWNSDASGHPGEPLRIIQWDKRSAKHFFDKFDILCLRGQDVLGGIQERLHVRGEQVDVAHVQACDDPDVYRAMRTGELVGIPQSASPAMRQAHVRLRTNDLHDASLVQAGIRPGVGGAVKLNELIARRRGKPFRYEHPKMADILGLTYGIIVFQEQVDQLLQTFAGCTSGEAEEIRDAIHKRRREDYAQRIRDELLHKVLSSGYSASVAEKVFDLVAGFKGYGFAQGHALAFAEISLRSVWCMQHFPADYFAALLSAQPAGYYGPATLANEARARGVGILRPCVQNSAREFTVEAQSVVWGYPQELTVRECVDGASWSSSRTQAPIALQTGQDGAREPFRLQVPCSAIRVGLMQVRGLSSQTLDTVLAQREHAPFLSLFDFVRRVRPHRDELEALILCGALDGLCPHRRAVLWAVPSALEFAHAARGHAEEQPSLPFELPEPPLDFSMTDFGAEEKACDERALLGLDVDRHLMAYERDRVARKGAMPAAESRRLTHGSRVIVVGHAIRLRFPPTSSGRRVVFFDLEDESGMVNVTCFDDVYQRDGHSIVCSAYLTVVGEMQARDGHTGLLAHRVFSYRPRMLGGRVLDLVSPADFLVG